MRRGVRHRRGARQDAHLRERGTIVDLDHPTRGRFSTIISPLRLSESPVEPRRAPLYGEHTEEVLRDLAGYSEAEIAACARRKSSRRDEQVSPTRPCRRAAGKQIWASTPYSTRLRFAAQ